MVVHQPSTTLSTGDRIGREWMAWATHYAPGNAPPTLPSELVDEVRWAGACVRDGVSLPANRAACP